MKVNRKRVVIYKMSEGMYVEVDALVNGVKQVLDSVYLALLQGESPEVVEEKAIEWTRGKRISRVVYAPSR